MQKTLALIFGGEGSERRISEMSAASVIEKVEDRIELLKIGITESGDWFIFEGETDAVKNGSWKNQKQKLVSVYPARLSGDSGFITADRALIKTDLAFPLLHGDFGEDGIVQGALRCAHIPYIGSDTASSALTSDKAYTKIAAEYLAIPTVPWFIPEELDPKRVRREAEKRLGYPFFIKPRRLGSSIGASPVHSRSEFMPAYETAVSVSGGLVMIEALADIKAELEFALYDGKHRFISREGIIHSSGKFYDFGAKYEGDGTPKIESSSRFDRKITRKARNYARRLADFLGLGNISRIDFFVTPSGELYFNEINSIPGMTENSLYPILAELSGNFKGSFIEDLVSFGKLQ